MTWGETWEWEDVRDFFTGSDELEYMYKGTGIDDLMTPKALELVADLVVRAENETGGLPPGITRPAELLDRVITLYRDRRNSLGNELARAGKPYDDADALARFKVDEDYLRQKLGIGSTFDADAVSNTLAVQGGAAPLIALIESRKFPAEAGPSVERLAADRRGRPALVDAGGGARTAVVAGAASREQPQAQRSRQTMMSMVSTSLAGASSPADLKGRIESLFPGKQRPADLDVVALMSAREAHDPNLAPHMRQTLDNLAPAP